MRPVRELPASPISTAAPARVQRVVLIAGVLSIVGLVGHLGGTGPRLALLLLLGVALGVTLYHAAFGFASAYRRLLLYRDIGGVRAQLLMLALATVLFAPVLAAGSVLGQGVVGAVAPLGWQVAIGAFLFGLGMQLGGGCGSGTLYTVGGGNVRMVITLVAFCAGSFWASLHMGWWQGLPAWQPVVLGERLTWPAAVAVQLGVIAALGFLLQRWAMPGVAVKPPGTAYGWRRIATGPWGVLTGAVLLALLNFATLLTAGHPWTITWAFTLWGAKAATWVSWDPASSAFWSGGFQRAALESSILHDVTSLMDIGILLGALSAAALAGRFAPHWRMPARSLAAALIGGLLMGYGARIGFGCNIGAFFSGVASTSLHGWLWIAAALAGTWLGVKLRPRFGLAN
jgi:uncharacterized protein